MVLPLLAAAASALGGAQGIGSIVGMTVIPALLEHIMSSGPDAEGAAKIKDTIDRLAMQHAQEQGISMEAARKQVADQIEPALNEAFSKKPGMLTDLVGSVGGALIGHKVGGMIGKRGAKAALGTAAVDSPATKPGAVNAAKTPEGQTPPGVMATAPHADNNSAAAATADPAGYQERELTARRGGIPTPDEDILAQMEGQSEPHQAQTASPDMLSGLGYPGMEHPGLSFEHAVDYIRPPGSQVAGNARGRGFSMVSPGQTPRLGASDDILNQLMAEKMRGRMYRHAGD